MEFIRNISHVPAINILIYYVFIAFSGLYIIWRYSFNKYAVLFVLVFWAGFFDYAVSITSISVNLIKVFTFLCAFFIFGKGMIWKVGSKLNLIDVVFILFSISYWISFALDIQNVLTVSSQYFLKYFFPFLVFHGLRFSLNNPNRINYFASIFILIVKFQILFSVLKILSIGGVLESIVGSLQYIGGGTAVSLSMLALLLIWLHRKGSISRYDWLFIFLVLVISFASVKRTPIFVFPVFLGLLFVYVKRSIKIFTLIKYTPLIVILFYFGVRSNATLNPDAKVGGKFDIEFVYNYVVNYNFGSGSPQGPNVITEGRGGSLFLLFDPESLNLKSIPKLFFGNSISSAVTAEKGRFLGGDEYNIDHEGLMGSITMEVYKIGYLGTSLFLLFIILMVNTIKNRKFRNLVFLWLFIDLFLYYGTTVFNPALSTLFVFIVYYSNQQLNYEHTYYC